MKCKQAQELFSTYLENTIQPPMGVALEQHLAECDQCKAAYGRFHATTVVLDELPEVEPPADLHAMIMARIEDARRTAPRQVRWWNIDWQSAFTVRVPAKAIAGLAAAVLALVGLAQFGPHITTASFLGGQREVSRPADDLNTAPVPLPQGFKSDADTQYVSVGSDLSIGVRVDSASESSTVYMMRLATPSSSAIPVEVSMLPQSQDGYVLKILRKGVISRDSEGAVSVEVTQSSNKHISDVVLVKWTDKGRSNEEYIFLPSAFGLSDINSKAAVSGQGAFSLLTRLSAGYGAVILAPGNLTADAEAISIQPKTASDAVYQVSKQADMTSQLVGHSLYIIK